MISIFLIIFASVNLIIYFKLNKIANLINIYDKPDTIRKFHLKNTPILGGIIFFFNFLIFLIFLKFYYSNNFYYFLYLEDLRQFYVWIIIITILFIISIYDDHVEIENFKKLIFISFLVYFYVNFDQTIQIKQFRFFNKEYNFSIGNISLVFTSLCVLSLIIALNMYDGVNTNSIGYFLFAFLYIVLKVENNIYFLFIIFILFFLFLLNFLGKLFMGDSGVNLFSFILGFIILKLYNLKLITYIEEVALMLFFPTVDMARVFIFRFTSKKSLFNADRKHLHHLIKDNYEKSYFYILLFLNSFPFFLLIIFPTYLYISLLICFSLYFFLLAKTKFINVRKF